MNAYHELARSYDRLTNDVDYAAVVDFYREILKKEGCRSRTAVALACGTGCGSVTCVLWALGELPGKHLITEVRGGKLEYHINGSDHVKELIMDGPTEILKIYEV